MHKNHPNLSDQINTNIAESELLGGVMVKEPWSGVSDEIKALPVLPVGHSLKVQTKHTLYLIEKRPEGFFISGHERFCPIPTECSIHGSTWGASMLKVSFVGRGMNLEFSTKTYPCVTTSSIQEITELDHVASS
jgi:hypothetical protein